MNTQGKRSVNQAVKITVATIGIIFGFGGISHGIFEAMQGNNPTGGLIIDAIGESHRMWIHGNEPAFTVIPNFLLTGIAAIVIGTAIIIWSAGYLHKKNASLVFLLLFILLFLVGGGIGQVIFFTLGWIMSLYIRRPLSVGRKIFSGNRFRFLSSLWLPLLTAATLLILFTLQIAVFGYVPGMSNPDKISMVMVGLLGAGLVFLIIAFLAGIARDVQRETR